MSISTPQRSPKASATAGDTTQTASTQKQMAFRDDQIMDDQDDPVWVDHDDPEQEAEQSEQQIVQAHRQVKEKEKEPDPVNDVVHFSRVAKLLKKRMREPKNIPKLVKV